MDLIEVPEDEFKMRVKSILDITLRLYLIVEWESRYRAEVEGYGLQCFHQRRDEITLKSEGGLLV